MQNNKIVIKNNDHFPSIFFGNSAILNKSERKTSQLILNCTKFGVPS